MRKFLMGTFIAAISMAATQAQADKAMMKTTLMEARSTLVTMVKDPAMRGAEQQAKVKSSADTMSEMLMKTTPPAGKEAAYKELMDTWMAFKKSREEDVVPMLIAGKQAEAEKIALGIQKERYEKMMAIVEAM